MKKYLNKNKINYLYSSASENVNWLLNIRGKDLPNSPIVNCKLIISNKGRLYLFVIQKFLNQLKNISKILLYNEIELLKTISNLSSGSFCIDKNTCSI